MGLGELKVQLQSYASNKYVQGSKEFLQSNSIVAKFAFLILVVILFSLFFSLGSFILSRIFTQDHNPILIDGMINSKQFFVPTINAKGLNLLGPCGFLSMMKIFRPRNTNIFSTKVMIISIRRA